MTIKINLPGDKIHHLQYSYGHLIFPLGFNKWICWFHKKEAYYGNGIWKYPKISQFRIIKINACHNCRMTGIG